jgi:tetratricopeptide (TPR) repeat protein
VAFVGGVDRPGRTRGLTARWQLLARASFAAALLPASVITTAEAATTFTKDVAPILFAHCAPCHRPGEVGGFSLLSFADARPRAASIARVTRARLMPPWKPEPIAGVSFVGERRLDQADIDTIARWVDGGALEGDPSELPARPRFPDGWRLGEPDLVVAMAAPYQLAARAEDVLRNFVIPIPLTSVRYVRGIELRPDNARVVHHANLRIDRTRGARALEGADGAPGFDGRLSAGAEFPDGQFLGWTPGQLPPLLSDGTAWRLEPGSDLVVQLHLRPTEQVEQVQVRVGFFLTDTPPARTPVMLRLGRQDIDIAPGAADYRVDDSYRLPVDAELLAIQPHAHFRAREAAASVELPDGSVRELLRIADWDFDWQDQYRYAEPVALPRGSILRMSFRYDNTAGNRRNPDRPPRRVRWGQQSSDEMGDVWFQVVTRSADDRGRLVANFAPKVLTEDVTGFETLLRSDPDNARLHEAAGALLLPLGQTARGIAHLREALRIEPESVEAHYNLATALVWQGRSDEALDHFMRALARSPDHVGAHVNLAAVLRARGDDAGAAGHLRRALAVDPRNAAAHANLGGVLLREGKISEAVAEYRAALQTNPDLLEPLTEIAWTLATSPDERLRRADEAVRIAERARAVAGDRDIRALDALAAAYAAARRFNDAAQTLQRAIAIVGAGASADTADTLRLLRERLALYKEKKPFRDGTRRER